jgi:uncharacterized protein
MSEETIQVPIEVPPGSLSEEALHGVIDNFIQREGTDYGAAEASYNTKIEQIRKQIEKGDVKIVFDPATESVTLLTKREWAKYSQQANHSSLSNRPD